MALGLVAKVYPADHLIAESLKVAKALAAKGRVALRAIKQVIDRGSDVDLKTGCALEVEAFGVCFASQDAKEGVAAFLEKRKPDFQGTLKS
jgi:enoyl-CoA hydratase